MPSYLDEIMHFYGSLLSGEGIDVLDDPAHYEEVEGAVYDTGGIVRVYTDAWLGTTPNQVTPAGLIDLFTFLNDFTDRLEEQVNAVMQAEGVQSCEQLAGLGGALGGAAAGLVGAQGGVVVSRPELAQVCIDLRRWRVRLDEYSMFLATLPPDDLYNREASLWEVTAPLFLGWYGGPVGTEVELAPGGFAEGFDTLIRHPPDIATPYSIANQVGVSVAWEKERRKRLRKDLGIPTPRDIRKTIYVAAGVVALALLISRK